MPYQVDLREKLGSWLQDGDLAGHRVKGTQMTLHLCCLKPRLEQLMGLLAESQSIILILGLRMVMV